MNDKKNSPILLLQKNTTMFQRSIYITYFLLTFLFLTNNLIAQSWQEVSKFVASDRSEGNEFGEVVAISGQYAVVGVPKESEDENGNNPIQNAGAVYLYEFIDGSWTQVQKIVPSERALGDSFGSSVALSDDFLAIGAINEAEDAEGNNSFSGAGAVYIFQKINGTWIQTQKLVASDRNGLTISNFGSAVSLSGSTLAVGAKREAKDLDGLNPQVGAGAVYLFQYEENNWTEIQKIIAFDRNSEDEFGASVSMSSNYLIVGASLQDLDENGENEITNAGAGYVFEKNNDTWEFTKKLVSTNRNSDDFFGCSVSISHNYIVIGAFFEDEDSMDENTLNGAGSAYIYKRGNEEWNFYQKIAASDREFGARFGASVCISNFRIVVGALFEDKNENALSPLSDAGAAYVYSLINNQWVETAKHVPAERAAGDLFGYSVAIDDNLILASAINEDEDASNENNLNNAGSAFLFNLSCSSPTISNVAIESCNSFLSPSEKFTWTESGIYTDTILNSLGCDSVITIDLTITDFNVSITNDLTSLTANISNASYIWINCNDNNSPIPNANMQTFTPIESGNYAVVVTLENCTDTSTCENITVVGIPDIHSNNLFEIFSNPTQNGIITIKGSDHASDAFISIFDITGKRLQHLNWNAGETIQVAIQAPSGIYLLHISAPNQPTYSFKIVKE